ncbi:MAG: hypothetical protein Gyms2KO_03370 [Gymnodinialimonas sp.]
MGYSLLEVLIAFSLMAATLTILLPNQTILLRRSSSDVTRLLAQDYALGLVATFGGTEELEVGRSSMTYERWTVETSVEPYPEFANEPVVFEVSVTVSTRTGRELANVMSLVVRQ